MDQDAGGWKTLSPEPGPQVPGSRAGGGRRPHPRVDFEHDLVNVRREVENLGVDYPFVTDNDYRIWTAFANHYWPALYFVDAQGQIRHHRFGEGDEMSEMVRQQLLADNFVSPNGSILATSYAYAAPTQLQAIVGNQAGGRILDRFSAHDLNLVMAPTTPGGPVRFRVHLDDQPPGAAHGSDVDDQGNGTLTDPRLYQLVRQPGPVSERTF